MSLRTSLIVFNAVALTILVLFVSWRVLSRRRNPDEPTPRNLARPLDDETLEGPRLERALGWALIFVMVTAIALPVYFLVEPERQNSLSDDFLEKSIERGAVLFANEQSEDYNSAFSLLCANCHGVDGGGGSAPFVLQPEADKCQIESNKGNPDVPECLPKQVSWAAPSLNDVLLRFTPEQVNEVITYGRLGTPMPPWGVLSGKGALNEQSVSDLVNYLQSIQITSAKAKAKSAEAASNFREDAADNLKSQQDALKTAQDDLAKAKGEGKSASVVADLAQAVAKAQAVVTSARAYADEVRAMSEGEVLFRLNCARCHTKGASYYDSNSTDLPEPVQGGGAYGPSLRGGSVLSQFPGEAGRDNQYVWVANGVPRNEQYGVRGISSGRMPAFAKLLTKAQIEAIIDYERSLN